MVHKKIQAEAERAVDTGSGFVSDVGGEVKGGIGSTTDFLGDIGQTLGSTVQTVTGAVTGLVGGGVAGLLKPLIFIVIAVIAIPPLIRLLTGKKDDG